MRLRIRTLFDENYRCYGYRRIAQALRREGISLSEKVERRLMADDSLIAPTPRRQQRFSSYAGERMPAASNLLNRNVGAATPNQKWLRDLTEIHVPAGKGYVSPIVGCFDSLIVA